VGRHTVPGTGQPTPDQGFWARLAATVVVVALVSGWLLLRGGDDEPVTTAEDNRRTMTQQSSTSPTPASPAATTTAPATTAASPSPSASASTTAPPSTTGRPPTLSFVLLRDSYITVRVPGGRTLVSRLFKKGQERSFDQKVLEVVNGRPSAVRFTVNGKPRKPGPAAETETFVVRRR
jgi:hypothetical protein